MIPTNNDNDVAPEEAGTKLWDRLLTATGTVSKAITTKMRDGYNSDDDVEGEDTHVLRVLKEYYARKGNGTPVWLGGTGENIRPAKAAYSHSRTSSAGSNTLNQTQSNVSSGPGGTGKVSLRGIYEQAAERVPAQREQISPRKPVHNQSPDAYTGQGDAATTAGSGVPKFASAGERFRERMKPTVTRNLSNGSVGEDVASNNSRLRRN